MCSAAGQRRWAQSRRVLNDFRVPLFAKHARFYRVANCIPTNILPRFTLNLRLVSIIKLKKSQWRHLAPSLDKDRFEFFRELHGLPVLTLSDKTTKCSSSLQATCHVQG